MYVNVQIEEGISVLALTMRITWSLRDAITAYDSLVVGCKYICSYRKTDRQYLYSLQFRKVYSGDLMTGWCYSYYELGILHKCGFYRAAIEGIKKHKLGHLLLGCMTYVVFTHKVYAKWHFGRIYCYLIMHGGDNKYVLVRQMPRNIVQQVILGEIRGETYAVFQRVAAEWI